MIQIFGLAARETESKWRISHLAVESMNFGVLDSSAHNAWIRGTSQIWLNTPSVDLSGETPSDLISKGCEGSVLALLENALTGGLS